MWIGKAGFPYLLFQLELTPLSQWLSAPKSCSLSFPSSLPSFFLSTTRWMWMHRHTHLQKKQKDIVKACFICCLYIILHSGCLKSAILRIDEEKLIFIVSFIKGLISESSLYWKHQKTSIFGISKSGRKKKWRGLKEEYSLTFIPVAVMCWTFSGKVCRPEE